MGKAGLRRRRIADCLALAAVGGALVGFLVIVSIGHASTDAEWKELIETPWIAFLQLGRDDPASGSAKPISSGTDARGNRSAS